MPRVGACGWAGLPVQPPENSAGETRNGCPRISGDFPPSHRPSSSWESCKGQVTEFWGGLPAAAPSSVSARSLPLTSASVAENKVRRGAANAGEVRAQGRRGMRCPEPQNLPTTLLSLGSTTPRGRRDDLGHLQEQTCSDPSRVPGTRARKHYSMMVKSSGVRLGCKSTSITSSCEVFGKH